MDRSELLTVIEEAKRSGQTRLDLSSKQITELPEEIGQLINLTSLDLRSNQLTVLPESIEQLTNLTSLDLSDNQLTALPESIEQLTNLTSLDLSDNQLTALPESIGQLTNLTFLNLSGNQLTALPESIGQLTNLTSLNLSDNQLTALPESIGQLTNLKFLQLLNNFLKTLPTSINRLSAFTYLDLSHNQLAAVPQWLGQLTNLTYLDLSHNDLTVLPGLLGQLTNLTSLDLSHNDLTVLPEWLGQLTNLTSLNLRYNQLAALPESIRQLTNLKYLNLWNNQLTVFPDSIFQLTNLISLDLCGNQLVVIPASIDQLINLEYLNLWDNQLTVLPDSICTLSRLRELDLTSNQLRTLPDLIGNFSLLRKLKITKNKLTTLPTSLVQLKGLSVLTITSNNLDLPPEISRKRSPGAILEFLRQQQEEGVDYIYEAKLLVIGEGGAGKTSLANKLINPGYKLKLESGENPEKSTEGIDVLRLDFPHSSGNTFRINLWDFGGQEIYHATHQFFLTKRSLYLLVADTRQDNTDFNYWLEVVELLSEASPTLIVKNEKQDRLCKINENQLRGRFPNLEKILPTNLADNRGLTEILTAIQHNISQLPHIGTPLPKTWVRVRDALEADNRNYITQSEFLTLCDTHGFKRHEDKLQLSGYLHDLGVCLHFQDDPVLKNIIILKPEWGTAAVYKVLDTKEVNQNLGCFTQNDLTQIWADEQYVKMRDELLQLMKKFKLCYEIPNRPQTYIAPQLLSPNQPEYDWDDADNLILRYRYDFMPKGMLTRFTVEMHQLIDRDLVWKDGVILTDSHAHAEVIEAYYKKEILIRISGKLKKPLLEKVRHEFSKIHASYNKPEEPPETHRLRYQEFIPCNCSVCNGSQTPHAYALQRLQERLKNNRYEIECDISYKMVSVRGLIDDTIGYNQPVQTNETLTKIYHSGDIVYGDKVGQDKVGRNKTEYP
jgi:internalin A